MASAGPLPDAWNRRCNCPVASIATRQDAAWWPSTPGMGWHSMAMAPRAASRASASWHAASAGTATGAATGAGADAVAAAAGCSEPGAAALPCGVGGGKAATVGGSAAAWPVGGGMTRDATRSHTPSLMADRTDAGTRWENIAIMGTTTMHATSRAERNLMRGTSVWEVGEGSDRSRRPQRGNHRGSTRRRHAGQLRKRSRPAGRRSPAGVAGPRPACRDRSAARPPRTRPGCDARPGRRDRARAS